MRREMPPPALEVTHESGEKIQIEDFKRQLVKEYIHALESGSRTGGVSGLTSLSQAARDMLTIESTLADRRSPAGIKINAAVKIEPQLKLVRKADQEFFGDNARISNPEQAHKIRDEIDKVLNSVKGTRLIFSGRQIKRIYRTLSPEQQTIFFRLVDEGRTRAIDRHQAEIMKEAQKIIDQGKGKLEGNQLAKMNEARELVSKRKAEDDELTAFFAFDTRTWLESKD